LNINSDHKILLIVIDGLGFSRTISEKILDDVWQSLDESSKNIINMKCKEFVSRNHLISPIIAESVDSSLEINTALEIIRQSKAIRSTFSNEMSSEIRSKIRLVSEKYQYIPWASKNEILEDIRNKHYTRPTHAAGVWVGYEDMDPTVQGNSETGHQQIGNLAIAPQIPMFISQSIKNKSFYSNTQLTKTIDHATNLGKNINISFMMSGKTGQDGRIHSSWNHLEALLELIFIEKKIPPEKVQIHAVLDGRDSSPFGSVNNVSPIGNYLDLLKELLNNYEAEQCLAWVIGRSIAMDRDYREDLAKTNYELITKGIGKLVNNFNELKAHITKCHKLGMTDQDIPPIVVSNEHHRIPIINTGDSFINLNFRSDRQRSITGSLANARNFLISESKKHGTVWKMDWMPNDLNLEICTLTEYHPSFERDYSVTVAFPIKPHINNFFSQWDTFNKNGKYLLVSESVKAPHMGYFMRGRREKPTSDNESSHIIHSHGKNEGIFTDTDFYKTPFMRNSEISSYVTSQINAHKYNLIACNLASPDMIGHLLPKRYNEALVAYESTANAINTMVSSALKKHFTVIITSDHGNIEENTPSHTSNDVLTTVITHLYVKNSTKSPYTINLFDIAPTIIELMRYKSNHIVGNFDNKQFIGKPFIQHS
jgi:2,3-bisphosphoglycerate-independent phosphoglycerate mutase